MLGYILSTSALLLPIGRVSDMLGRERVFMSGLIGFIVLGALGGASQSFQALIIAKVLQGVAAAAIQANGMAMIMDVFPRSDRGQAIGMYMTIIGTGSVTGPIIGGTAGKRLRLEGGLLRRRPGRAHGLPRGGAGSAAPQPDSGRLVLEKLLRLDGRGAFLGWPWCPSCWP